MRRGHSKSEQVVIRFTLVLKQFKLTRTGDCTKTQEPTLHESAELEITLEPRCQSDCGWWEASSNAREDMVAVQTILP